MLILINLFAHLGNDEEETENNEMLSRNTNKRKKNNKQIAACNASNKEGKQLSTCV